MIPVKFPNNEEFEFEQGKPIVMLGANGSGKTRLAVKIEELNDVRWHLRRADSTNNALLIHRLSAQKSLTISEKINLSDYNSSQNALFLGHAGQNNSKYSSRFRYNPATHLLNDYDQVLAAVFATDYKELQKDHKTNKDAVDEGVPRPLPITTVREKATKIWNDLLPQRKIELEGGSIHASYNDTKYHGKEMSDGERVMLYLICQVLVLPRNSILIIDEPELHIHKAILKKLWDKLEGERSDCVFFYITHDLDFAVSRKTSKTLWVKSFDGETWDYEFLDVTSYGDLPDELLYEIIGTREKLLFVEGDKNSYDHALYSEFFRDKDYHIIPCGGCSEVIKIYKSKETYENLSHVEACCLIDRDYRTDDEISRLEAAGVNVLKVAEVENLFVVPALIDIMGEQFGCSPEDVAQAKDFITELFNSNKPEQIGDALRREINRQLTAFNFRNTPETLDSIKNSIADAFSVTKMQEFSDEKQQLFDAVADIDDILRVFNFKELRKKIGKKLGVDNYPERVIRLLKTNPDGVRDRIIDALKSYIPEFP